MFSSCGGGSCKCGGIVRWRRVKEARKFRVCRGAGFGAFIAVILLLSGKIAVGYQDNYVAVGLEGGAGSAATGNTADQRDPIANTQRHQESSGSYLYEHVELDPLEGQQHQQRQDAAPYYPHGGNPNVAGSGDVHDAMPEQAVPAAPSDGGRYYDYFYDDPQHAGQDFIVPPTPQVVPDTKDSHKFSAVTAQQHHSDNDSAGGGAPRTLEDIESVSNQLQQCHLTTTDLEQRIVEATQQSSAAVHKISLERDSCEAASTQLYASYERCRNELASSSNCTAAAEGASLELQECTLNLAQLETSLTRSMDVQQQAQLAANDALEAARRSDEQLRIAREDARRTAERFASEAHENARLAETKLKMALQEGHNAATARDAALARLAVFNNASHEAFSARDALDTWHKFVHLARAVAWVGYDRLGVQHAQAATIKTLSASRSAAVQLLKRRAAPLMERFPQLIGAAEHLRRAKAAAASFCRKKVSPVVTEGWRRLERGSRATARHLNDRFDDLVVTRLGSQYPELRTVIPTSPADRVAMLAYVWAILFVAAHLLRVLVHFMLMPLLVLFCRPCRRRARMTVQESGGKKAGGGFGGRSRGKVSTGYVDHSEGSVGPAGISKKLLPQDSEFRPAATATPSGPTPTYNAPPNNNSRGSRKGPGSSKRS